jgi:dipeptidase
MRGIDILAAFELEINKIDNTLQKPLTDDSLYWINQAVMKFVKDRFNGNATKRTSYEQNEKRTRDLINLLKE